MTIPKREAWRELFTQLLGPAAVFAEDLDEFAKDETHELYHPPDLVLKPADRDQVVAIMQVCHHEGIPVTPRGAGSGVSGGALAVNGGIVLSLERLNRVIDIDDDNMTVTVETGVITGKLQQQLLERNFFLPPDPGSSEYCQIGGNLAEAAAGPRSVKYGAFRDYVLNLEVVLPGGEVIWTSASVRKSACGYNLTQLMLGSEGTLGVVTKVVFRLISPPRHEVLLRLAFADLEAACTMICRVFNAGLQPCLLEFMDRDAIEVTALKCSEALPLDTEALLWIGFDGPRLEALLEDMEKVGELAEELGAAEPLFAEEDERRDQLFEYRRQVGEAVIETTTFRDVDISFPRSKLFEVVTGVKKIGQRHGFRSVIFGHCGDGNVHVQVLRNDLDDAAWQGPVRDGIRAIYQLATALGGALSGEHGIGCTLLPYLDLMYDEVVLDLMRGIKRTFDPKGILNPGKVVVDKAR